MSAKTRNIKTNLKGIPGGDGLEFASGSELAVETGAKLDFRGAPVPGDITFSAAAGAANVCEVTVTVADNEGTAIAHPIVLDLWLSDAATGIGLTGTTASGTVTAKAASGAVFSEYTAKKDLRIQTLATGVFILEITDTAKTGFFVAARNPFTGRTVVSAQLQTADYGA